MGPLMPILIQLPILIALYRVFWSGLNPKELLTLYSFVANPVHINPLFIHIVNLSEPNMILAVLAGLTQYFQTKMMLPKKSPIAGDQGKQADFANMMQKQMTYFMPVFTVIILVSLPSALGLYWTISGLFSIVQQYLIVNYHNKPEIIKT